METPGTRLRFIRKCFRAGEEIRATVRQVANPNNEKSKKGYGFMSTQMLIMVASGVLVGIGAAFTGLGGGFLMVPILLFLGYSAQKAVGTSFLAILVISISALIAHNKFANVDYKTGFLLGVGGIVGAQVGARLVEHVSTAHFKKIFAIVLVGLAMYLFVKK